MSGPPESLVVGLAQIAPIWLDRTRTLEKVIGWIEQAAKQRVGLLAFGEALVPGYPFWLGHTEGARFDSPIQKEIHARYLEQAVDLDAGHLDGVRQAARDAGLHVFLGCYERPRDRGGHTGYCSLVSIDGAGEIRSVHRKLMPTYEERLAWGIGDGHGLTVQPIGPFSVGALNCWENWMPLVRSSLYAQGENLHVAVWPGSARNTREITRFIAREARSYVLSVSGVLRRDQLPDDLPQRELIATSLPETMADGGSCIAGPTGAWILEPAGGDEQLLVAELGLEAVYQERQNFDPSGHYSRPDVVRLHVDRRRQSVVDIRE